ncbi:MAG: YHS domain-containing protein [Hydrogenophaga sp.]|jgi:YHS domain-containing protein
MTATASHLARSLTAFTLLAALAGGLSGCSALSAQNPSGTLKPVNAVEMPPSERVMLKGADVVAYFTEGAYRQGIAEHQSTFEGVSFWFASAAHQAQFEQSPQRYLPQYGGYCANGIAYGIPWGGDPDTWKITDGKLYIFGGQASQDGWELDEPANFALAEKYWSEEVSGNNSFWQRTKRMVLRVPHYKSGEQLAGEVAAAKAARQ